VLIVSAMIGSQPREGTASTAPPPRFAPVVTRTDGGRGGNSIIVKAAPNSGDSQLTGDETPAPKLIRNDGERTRIFLIVVEPIGVGLLAMRYWFSRPRKIMEAVDSDAFTKALEEKSDRIFDRYRSPREVRRFINYLRLVVMPSGQRDSDEIAALRTRNTASVDPLLVALAVDGVIQRNQIPRWWRGIPSGNELFGLDSQTFQPLEDQHRRFETIKQAHVFVAAGDQGPVRQSHSNIKSGSHDDAAPRLFDSAVEYRPADAPLVTP
jgi:hypothetical protein